MHGTDFHCVEVVFATVTATGSTKWLERLTEEWGWGGGSLAETRTNVDHLMRADGAGGLGKKSNLEECRGPVP